MIIEMSKWSNHHDKVDKSLKQIVLDDVLVLAL